MLLNLLCEDERKEGKKGKEREKKEKTLRGKEGRNMLAERGKKKGEGTEERNIIGDDLSE